MALNKEIIAENGVTTTYHRVDHVNLNDNILFFQVSSYVSEIYRSLDKPVVTNHYDYEITLGEEESMGIRQLCYAKLKESEYWADAIDC